jgi:hypothetical protein
LRALLNPKNRQKSFINSSLTVKYNGGTTLADKRRARHCCNIYWFTKQEDHVLTAVLLLQAVF